MTGDARGEAERIVEAYSEVAFEIGTGVGRNADEYQALREGLVAALAAAIEETDAEDALAAIPLADDVGEANDRLYWARDKRREALSALRARAGEET